MNLTNPQGPRYSPALFARRPLNHYSTPVVMAFSPLHNMFGIVSMLVLPFGELTIAGT